MIFFASFAMIQDEQMSSERQTEQAMDNIRQNNQRPESKEQRLFRRYLERIAGRQSPALTFTEVQHEYATDKS